MRSPRLETEILLAKAAEWTTEKADLDRQRGEYTGDSGAYYFREDAERLDRIALEFEDALVAAIAGLKEEKP